MSAGFLQLGKSKALTAESKDGSEQNTDGIYVGAFSDFDVQTKFRLR
jgi:hypothetical protein